MLYKICSVADYVLISSSRYSSQKMTLSICIVLLLVGGVFCAPLGSTAGSESNAGIGIQLNTNAEELPTLKLPYSTYRAKSYDKKNDVRYCRL